MPSGKLVPAVFKPAWLAVILAGWAIVASSGLVCAGEWPQILGPQRNGAAEGEKLINSFPASGPASPWNRPVGEGFAGVAIAKGRLVLFHRQNDREIAEALDPGTAQPIWKQEFPARYAGGISSDHGPRCVPVIHQDAVYVFGAAGDLHCLAFRDGQPRWSRSLYQDYKAPEGYFGAGSTPIVEGNRLLVNVGGKSESGIVALSLATGKTEWTSTSEQASYSSPIAVTLDGVRQVIFVTRLSALSLDPENGHVRWKFRFGAPGPTVNAASPLVFREFLFLTASYGVGAACARIGSTSAETLWENNDTMSSQYSTCVFRDGFMYGIDGRQDGGTTRLRCFDPRTGDIIWSQDEFGIAAPILADGKLVLWKADGTLVLAEATPKAYRELGRARVLKGTCRALPALSNGLLFVRNDDTLKCVNLGREK